ncbi:MAG: hypothetical protein V3T30_03415 [Thermodesulfobacteriota bacterium]
MISKGLIDDVRPGLVIAGFFLLFGISMGIVFGLFEDDIKAIVNAGVDAYPLMHTSDPNAKAKIFRWWQRAHFHGTGIGAFTMALISVVAISNLKPKMKTAASMLIGMGGLYAVSWLVMAIKAPAIGRGAAHHLVSVHAIVSVSIGCLLLGMGLLFSSIIFGWFSEKH